MSEPRPRWTDRPPLARSLWLHPLLDPAKVVAPREIAPGLYVLGRFCDDDPDRLLDRYDRNRRGP